MAQTSPPKRPRAHDHRRCIRDAVATAETLCEERQIKFTPLRKRVLEIIWRRHEPIGAYQILAEIAKDRGKAAPPTVYRVLDVLKEAGLVHRLDSINAFVGCDRPQIPHPGHFLVCGKCHRVSELDDAPLSRALTERARAQGFLLENSAVEFKAICVDCAGQAQ